jgi:hypothetical protein
MKSCSKCLNLKSKTCFNKNKNTKTGLHSQCRECQSISKKEWYGKNLNHCNLKSREHYLQNRERIIKQVVARQSKRRREDILVKLTHTLRKRFNVALKNNYKSGSAVRDLGCSISELKSHLEDQFKPGMSWDNYGKCHNKWQIDHIIPFCQLDLSKLESIKKVCHYTNLQPLWYKDHIIKSKKDTYGYE